MQSVELLILKLFLEDKQKWRKYERYFSTDSLEPEFKVILNCIKKYYKTYNSDSIVFSELSIIFETEYPNIKGPELYAGIFADLKALPLNQQLANDLILQFVEKDFTNRIINKGIQNLSGNVNGIMVEIEQLVHTWNEIKGGFVSEEAENVFYDLDLQTLVDKEINAEGLSWRLKEFNDHLGPLRGGRLGHIFGSRDAGKTSLWMSEMSYFAKQLFPNENIICVNNEERKTKVGMRIFCSVLNATQRQIENNMERASIAFRERNGHLIRLYDRDKVYFDDIEALIKEFRPLIMIIDNADKVRLKSHGRDLEGEARISFLYQEYRRLVKNYECDIITVGQASKEGNNRKFLTDDLMAKSKVDKPGEMDFAIGIGVTDKVQATRYISVCKNKDGPHGGWVCTLDPERARFSGI